MILFAFLSADAVPAQTITDTETESDQFCSCGRNRNIRTKSCTELPMRDRKGRSCPCSIAKRKCTAKCKRIPLSLDVETKIQQKILNADAALERETKTTSHPVMTNPRVEKRSVHASHKAVLADINVVASTAEINFGVRVSLTSGRRRAQKITSGSPSSMKRKRCSDYLNSAGFEVELGSWTSWETCILNTTESFISSTLHTSNNRKYSEVI